MVTPSHWKFQSWWKTQSMDHIFLSFSSPKRESRFRIHPRCICTGQLDGIQECYYTTTAVCFARPPVIMARHHEGFSALHEGQHVAIVWRPNHIAIYFPTISLSFQQFLDIFRACKKNTSKCVNVSTSVFHSLLCMQHGLWIQGLELWVSSACRV